MSKSPASLQRISRTSFIDPTTGQEMTLGCLVREAIRHDVHRQVESQQSDGQNDNPVTLFQPGKVG